MRRPSSSTGILGKRSMNIRVKTPAPVRAGIPPAAPYTFTRSIPELGESFLQMYPHRSRPDSSSSSSLRPPLHPFRLVDPGPVRDQERVLRIADESHRLARDGKPAVDLRADPHPLDEGTQRLVQEEVPLVPSVVAHLLPQQAGADEDLDPFRQTASP